MMNKVQGKKIASLRNVSWRVLFYALWLIVKPALRKPSINPLKPTGYVMHHQFNIQQLYALPTLCLCVLYLSENKQRLVPPTA